MSARPPVPLPAASDLMPTPSCLVTGATGFLGRHLVSHLVEGGHSTRVLTRRPPEEAKTLLGEAVQIISGDLRDRDAVRAATTGVEIVFHLAAQKHHGADLESVNIDGTRSILAASADAQIRRFVHISSAGVSGPPRNDVVSEEVPCAPRGDYEQTKRIAEELVLGFGRALPVAVLRPANVFGECDPARPLLNLTGAIQSGRFRYVGDGHAMLNYVYVGDVAQACRRVAIDAAAIGQVYLLSDPCSLVDFIEVIAACVGVPPPRAQIAPALAWALAVGCDIASFVTKRPFPLSRARVRAMRSRHVYSSDKLRLAWPEWPRIGWREGLRRTLNSYRELGLLS